MTEQSKENNIVFLNNIQDKVFFRKTDVGLGTVLEYFGRHAPGSKWSITKIYTFEWHNGQVRSKQIDYVSKLDDEIVLSNINGKAFDMHLTFGYLSYSSIWRISDEQINK